MRVRPGRPRRCCCCSCCGGSGSPRGRGTWRAPPPAPAAPPPAAPGPPQVATSSHLRAKSCLWFQCECFFPLLLKKQCQPVDYIVEEADISPNQLEPNFIWHVAMKVGWPNLKTRSALYRNKTNGHWQGPRGSARAPREGARLAARPLPAASGFPSVKAHSGVAIGLGWMVARSVFFSKVRLG